jgi:hypothetical protein
MEEEGRGVEGRGGEGSEGKGVKGKEREERSVCRVGDGHWPSLWRLVPNVSAFPCQTNAVSDSQRQQSAGADGDVADARPVQRDAGSNPFSAVHLPVGACAPGREQRQLAHEGLFAGQAKCLRNTPPKLSQKNLRNNPLTKFSKMTCMKCLIT